MKIKNKFLNIKLIFYDFDGIFTNNKFYLTSKNEEIYYFNKSDSLAISLIKSLNIEQTIITAEKSNIVNLRAKKMGINVLVSNKKLEDIKNIIKQKNLKINNVAFIGNDLNDLAAIKYLKHTFCPKDSDELVIKYSNHCLKKNGGEGVIKEFFKTIFSL